MLPIPNVTFGDFLEGVALPFYRSKWKRSTASTTESRIRHHLLREFGPREASNASHLSTMQAFLDGKAASALKKHRGASAVGFAGHYSGSLWRKAISSATRPGALFTPKEAKVAHQARHEQKGGAATHQRARSCASASSTTWRCSLACGRARYWPCSGGTSREDCSELVIEQRLYRGDIDDPKTDLPKGPSALPPETARELKAWMESGGKEAGGVGFRVGEPGKALVAG